MPIPLDVSASYCVRLARERAKNFYYGFLLLPKPRRYAFCAIYAFMRYCDDVADGDCSIEEKSLQLRNWRAALDRALKGDYGDSPILPAFHDAVQRYSIPPQYLHDLITGTEMDLSLPPFQTFDDLYNYCYHVASVVGLCSIHILGYRDHAACKYAEDCGIAFQLTNILRDLREDAQNGRIYLPLEDLQRFNYSADDLRASVFNQQFRSLLLFEIDRSRQYYRRASPLLDLVDPESRPALWAIMRIYEGILDAIERNGGNVFVRRAGLSDMQKIYVLFQASSMRYFGYAHSSPEERPHHQ